MRLILPAASPPREHPSDLWTVQLHLLRLAEKSLGPRDASKRIYQPVFHDDGPRIRNTPNLDGAFAELSRNSEAYWPTAIYELAHETVHLLNPKSGVGNWLSEGVAVAFSIYAQRCFSLEPQCIGMQSYRRALELVSELSGGPLEAGRSIRNACGALSSSTKGILEELFPDIAPELLAELTETFVRD